MPNERKSTLPQYFDISFCSWCRPQHLSCLHFSSMEIAPTTTKNTQRVMSVRRNICKRWGQPIRKAPLL